jgi:hypothetical protein
MSDQTPDSPARPQYGEYATAEEQRARIRQPDVTESLAAGRMAPEPASPRTGPPAPPGTTAPRVRRFDRIITFALLAYGLVTVITSIPAFADYGRYADFVFDFLGIDAQLADPTAGRPWGIAAALVLAVGWLVTAAVSWWSVRRGRLTWWIPVVGGIIFMTVASFLLLVPMMGDQAVWDAIVDRR